MWVDEQDLIDNLKKIQKILQEHNLLDEECNTTIAILITHLQSLLDDAADFVRD